MRFHLLLPRLLVVLAINGISTSSMFAEDWPGYRGPTGMGRSVETGLPLEWGGEGDKSVLWKVPLPPTIHRGDADHNQSSPVVIDGKVLVTTCHWPTGVDKASQAPEHRVASYEAATGKALWDTKVPPGPWVLTDLRGGYASPLRPPQMGVSLRSSARRFSTHSISIGNCYGRTPLPITTSSTSLSRRAPWSTMKRCFSC